MNQEGNGMQSDQVVDRAKVWTLALKILVPFWVYYWGTRALWGVSLIGLKPSGLAIAGNKVAEYMLRAGSSTLQYLVLFCLTWGGVRFLRMRLSDQQKKNSFRMISMLLVPSVLIWQIANVLYDFARLSLSPLSYGGLFFMQVSLQIFTDIVCFMVAISLAIKLANSTPYSQLSSSLKFYRILGWIFIFPNFAAILFFVANPGSGILLMLLMLFLLASTFISIIFFEKKESKI